MEQVDTEALSFSMVTPSPSMKKKIRYRAKKLDPDEIQFQK